MDSVSGFRAPFLVGGQTCVSARGQQTAPAETLQLELALDGWSDTRSTGEKNLESLQQLKAVAGRNSGSVEGQFAQAAVKSVQGIDDQQLVEAATSTALAMLEGGITGPAGAAICKLGYAINNQPNADFSTDRAAVSQSLLEDMVANGWCAGLETTQRLLESPAISDRTKQSLATSGFLSGLNAAEASVSAETLQVFTALNAGISTRLLNTVDNARAKEIVARESVAAYSIGLGQEPPGQVNDAVEQRLKRELLALLEQAPDGAGLLARYQRHDELTPRSAEGPAGQSDTVKPSSVLMQKYRAAFDTAPPAAGPVRVHTQMGDIGQVKADGIIANITSVGSGVDPGIRQQTGVNQFLQQAAERRPLYDGDTVVAAQRQAHQGAFQNVVFVVDDAEKPLREVVLAGLKAADAAGLESASLPAMRTGFYLGVKEATLAETMQEMAAGLREFQETNPSHLKEVTFVVNQDAAVKAALDQALAALPPVQAEAAPEPRPLPRSSRS